MIRLLLNLECEEYSSVVLEKDAFIADATLVLYFFIWALLISAQGNLLRNIKINII